MQNIKPFGKYGVVYNNKFETILPTIKSESIDCVIIDPPYVGYNGKNPVLAGHKIQTVIDLDLVCSEAYRVLKPNSFFAFFGQMPTIIDWYAAAKKAGFEFAEDITWVKRVVSNPYAPIIRKKENIFIVKKGNPKYNKTNATFEDIKMPLYLDGLHNIESIKRCLSALKTGKNNCLPKKEFVVSNDKTYHKKQIERHYFQEEYNFSDVWSFLPHNKRENYNEEYNIKHPSVKPIPLLERLIELLTFENATVLDCFIGSGTTFLAGIRTGRQTIGVELFEEYFDITCNRIEKEIKLKEQELF